MDPQGAGSKQWVLVWLLSWGCVLAWGASISFLRPFSPICPHCVRDWGWFDMFLKTCFSPQRDKPNSVSFCSCLRNIPQPRVAVLRSDLRKMVTLAEFSLCLSLALSLPSQCMKVKDLMPYTPIRFFPTFSYEKFQACRKVELIFHWTP